MSTPDRKTVTISGPNRSHTNSSQNALEESLQRFNARWEKRWNLFRTYSTIPGWWSASAKPSRHIRAQFEIYMPMAEFCRDLAHVAAYALPHPSWIPHLLRTRVGHTQRTPLAETPQTVADLWRMLPARFTCRGTLDRGALLPFLCALADPARFGTAPNRYPRQLESLLEQWRKCSEACRILDLGCGVGLGTLEIAGAVRQIARTQVQAVGITREPLEAWMAHNRTLPHDPERQTLYAQFDPDLRVQFLAGDVLRIPLAECFNVVLCNGLVGGPMLHEEHTFDLFLEQCRIRLAPGGTLLVANSFHEGRTPYLKRFMRRAETLGWSCDGQPSDLRLTRPP